MARYRSIPNCMRCDKPMKGVYNDMGKHFVGDTFTHWEHDGKCIGETKEYKAIKKSTNRRTLRANPKVTPAIRTKAKKAVKSLRKRTVKISPVLKKRTLNKARKAVQSLHNSNTKPCKQ